MTGHSKTGNPHSRAALPYAKQAHKMRPIAAIMNKAFSLGVIAACLVSLQVSATEATARSAGFDSSSSGHEAAALPNPVAMQSAALRQTGRAYFAQEIASADARGTADWIVDSGDNQHRPFLIVDKENAKIFAFDADGQIQGTTAALLGMARGDDSTPGIGKRKLSTMRPDERTTPAGRFVATLGRNLQGKEILWIDYDAAISLHRVITSNVKEQRAERLMSSTIADNRISYGCINVPVSFYENIVSPAFRKAGGIVYVLPETRSMHETFGSYDVDDRALQRLTSASVPAENESPVGRIIKLR